MPVELRIETEGKSEQRRVDLSGTESRYTVETFGRPRRITIDPENWILKSTPDLAVRVAVLRGQQAVAQGDLIGAIAEYQKALDSNRGSSLANLPPRRGLLHPEELPVLRQQLPRRSPRRQRPQVDRGLVPRQPRQDLRHHRSARARRQRVSPGRPDQRQHPGRPQRSPRSHAKTLQTRRHHPPTNHRGERL